MGVLCLPEGEQFGVCSPVSVQSSPGSVWESQECSLHCWCLLECFQRNHSTKCAKCKIVSELK